MLFSRYVLPAAVLSIGVNAFYPYIRPSTAVPSLTSRLVERFYPFHLRGSSSSGDDATHDELLTLPLKKRSTVNKRENKYTIVHGNPATGPNSATVNEDGNDFSYFFEMDFGSNNQSMWILFDTGGTNSWVFGTNCTVPACEMHNTFGQNDSTTLQTSGNTFSVGYGSGTVSGLLSSDTVKLANFSFQLTFGLVNNASKDFVDYPMDGILGLGRSKSSTTGTSTAMEAIDNAKLLPSNIVGISLQRNEDGAKDGEVTFGGVDASKFEGDITYTSVISTTDRWEIPLGDAVVAGTRLNVTGKSAIIDTGTSYIFLPPADASALHALIPGSALSGQEYTFPCSTNTTVQFTFSGVTYSVSPKDYIGSTTENGGTTCFSNIIAVQTFGPDDWLLGDVFMKNVYSVFDFDQNRIGFAARNGTAATISTASPVSAAASSGNAGTTTSPANTTTQTASATHTGAYTGAAASFSLPSLVKLTTSVIFLGLYFLSNL
ncbi:aspartic-type endopeptidase (CtsD), putative [Talaromyces stipitatus ATCC 10500]|uniref:Aspartic-type endopeptidase (CtsD), putative n=1 Tax=Talaromyces stipitatus (strain ATCC 10500 / CBS 375.48 / QM 6759 / NRRL 1006) TaxID=441959 RepID=B8LUJ6_TALSN|nr:aspartic-type endopeptidase (CtsD), putative [Talaromyces stipitatus ATCC 10500]EED23769.1 aspartic-type endopeptidase (CtsD), putative [Talaromyces stipitatus ATCC 10500]